MRVITVAIGIFLLCGPAGAQQVDPAAAVQSRKAYDDCVYESVAAQLQQMPISARRNADISSLGEQGFVACATEERVLGMTLTINNVSPQVVQAALLGIRAQIKRTLYQIADNSKNNGGPQTTTSGIQDSGETGGYMVQVSSQRNEADAQASYRALQGKYPKVLGSRSPVIKRADLGDKGVYYRAMVGPFGSPDEAKQFCGSLKTAGGQCVVQRD
jgi:SPOR domain